MRSSGAEIWVATGLYKPTAGTNRSATHQLTDGVRVYGGFNGTEATLAQRAGLFDQTILSGEIGAAGAADNSYHVVSADCLSSSALLDGFTIRDGNANAASGPHTGGGGLWVKQCTAARAPSCVGPDVPPGSPAVTTGPNVRRCTFIDNRAVFGGAIALESGTGMMTIIDCRFLGNTASASGGAIDSSMTGNVAVSNCLFTGNSCTNFTGGAVNNRGSMTMINCTIAFNASANLVGGVFTAGGSSTNITNCILWANADQNGELESAQIAKGPSGILAVNYCDVQGLTSNISNLGTGNIDVDPQFFDGKGPDLQAGTLDDDCRLTRCSNVIDAAHSASVPGLVAKDLGGFTRIRDDFAIADTGAGGPPVVDMGAYEFPPGLCLEDVTPYGGDGAVSIADVTFVLTRFGHIGGPADVNCDGVVSVHDIILVMTAYGGCVL
jgi:predicted outer membrane repeat protein